MTGLGYVSTRGSAPRLGFADVLLAGLAADGGLYVPERLPALMPSWRQAPERGYAATGGWGYTEFTWPDKARVAQIEANPQGCDGCHQKNAPGGCR